MKITFVQTGGTIDKDYPKKAGAYAFEISSPAVERILEKLNPTFVYEILSVLKKDSLDITEEDRQEILKICKEVDNDKIILTHGSDTMCETAKVLSEITDKTIIITGSLRPERFANSDAPVTVGMAIGAIAYLSPGVYIAMQSGVLPWNKCKKDKKTDTFVEI